MAIRRHPGRTNTHGRFRGAKERLRRPHVALLAQHCVDQVAVPIDRSIEVAPPAADLQVGLVNVPADTGFAPGTLPPFAQCIAHDRQQLRLPSVANGLVAYLQPPQCHDLAYVAQREPVAQPAEHDEGDNVAGQAGPVQYPAAALVELPTAVPAAKPPVALGRDLTTLRNRRRAAADTIHLEIDPAPAASSPTKSAAGRQTNTWRET